MLSDLFIRLRSLFRHNAVEGELDEELRFHLEHQVEKYVQSGLTREEAVRRTRIEFGGLEQVKENCREARGVTFAETLAKDVRFGLRFLSRSPGFTSVVVLTLGLGIGATAAIFTVFDQVLLRVLPVEKPHELVRMEWHGNFSGAMSAFGGDIGNYYSYPTYKDLRDRNQVFSGVLAAVKTNVGVLWHNQAEDEDAEVVSGGSEIAGLFCARERAATASTTRARRRITRIGLPFVIDFLLDEWNRLCS